MAEATQGCGRDECLEGDCSGTPRYVGGTGRLTQSITFLSVLHIILFTLRFKYEDESCSL